MDFCISSILLGYIVSTLGGALVLYIVIDICIQKYIEHYHGVGEIKEKDIPHTLHVPLGILERAIFTTSFLVGGHGIIAVWVAIKAALHWPTWQIRGGVLFNRYLIGIGLNIAIAFLGACIVRGEVFHLLK